MKRLFSVIAYAMLLFWAASLQAEPKMFKRINVDAGLSNSSVKEIYQDSKGFMWFCTASGLNRYDGYEFKVYLHQEDDTTSLPDNFITRITETSDGLFWIKAGTNFVLFDTKTDRFIHDVRSYMAEIGTARQPDELYCDRAGREWFYINGEGCYRYDRKEKKAVFCRIPNESIANGEVSAIQACGEGILLFFNNGFFVCLDQETLTVKWINDTIAGEFPKSISESFSCFVDSEGYLWIYSTAGLWVYDAGKRQFRPEYIPASYTRQKDFVHSVTEDGEGNIWLGKDYGGIEVINKNTRSSVYLQTSDTDERSLPHNTVYALYTDRNGLIWVGTYKRGLACYGEGIYKFGIRRFGDITFIEEAQNGALWLGTNDKGVMRWSEEMASPEYYNVENGRLDANIVVSLLQASDGSVWIGTFCGGLTRIEGNKITTFRAGAGKALASDNVWSLAEDASGNIWIGTLGGGLQCFDAKKKTFTTYDWSNTEHFNNHIASLCVRGNELQIGTSSEGIRIMDMKSGRVTKVLNADSCGLINNFINHLYTDSRGLLWIGTREGLSVYDLKTDCFMEMPQLSGMSGKMIAGITEDENHQMWISAANSLIHVKVAAGKDTFYFTHHVYDAKDGLQNGDFNLRSIRKLRSGMIVAGGLNGINYFNPRSIRYNRISSRILFSSLSLFGEEVKAGMSYDGNTVLPGELNECRTVTLDYKQNIFTVSFASDNLELPEKTIYSYKLDGFSTDWLTLPAGVHKVSFTNLAPNAYTLRVKAVNNEGYTESDEAMLTIVVHPPFWMTPWAYSLYITLVVLLLLLGYYLLLKRERNKFRIRQIEEEAARKEEINNMKFRFFTNISHELRTPLTLIVTPLEKLLREEGDQNRKTQLQLMYRNANRLLALVNQLLDFRKGEMSKHQLNLAEGDVTAYLQGVCNSFLLLADRKNIRFRFFAGVESFFMAFDPDKLTKIMMNLLSNAFKFTPEGGRVNVFVEIMNDAGGEYLEIKVSDTGIGIRDEEKAYVFNRFYQTEHPEVQETTGTGIGLSLVKEFADLHGGEVKVFDNIGSGSVFVIHLPVAHVEVKLAEEPCLVPPELHDEIMERCVASVERSDLPLLLLVDDNADFRTFMEQSLRLQYRTVSAANGQEAWAMLAGVRPDLIISDVMMPEMDGNELCRRIKEDKQLCRIPVILLTARQTTESHLEGLQTGADEYVTKPFNMTILELRIRKLIELSRSCAGGSGMLDPSPSEITITSLDEKLVGRAIAYVEENISRSELSVEELSRELGMSRVHLYKKLLQITGKTPIEFIRVIRLKRAAQLLRESQLHVSEIAFEVGFNNPKYFSRYFKEEFGELPSVYQEKAGK